MIMTHNLHLVPHTIFHCSGAIGVNLESLGPIQQTVSNVQCTGLESELLSCYYKTVTAEMPCELAAAGIVCQGSYTAHY